MQIAIDGPSGSGKSTLAKLLAARLGLVYLDTGAMYRALGVKALSEGIHPGDAAVCRLLPETILDVRYADGVQRIWLDGADVTDTLRTPEASSAASQVSAHGNVRAWMVALQQAIAARCDVVMDGRDIGTVVLPGADYKFFLTASVEERAARRFAELHAHDDAVTLETVRADIVERDARDTSRAVSPLAQAADALLIDTSGLGIDAVLEVLLHHMSM